MPGPSAAAYAALARCGVAAALRRRDAAPIFCFHNVVADAIAGSVGDRSLHIARTEFAAIARWIAGAFSVIPLAELVGRLAAGRRVGGTAALTFDDAYRGALRHALPILRQHALPATVFVVVNAAEHPRPFWWDGVAADADSRDRLLVGMRGDADRIAAATPAAARVEVPDELLPADWALLRASFDATVTPGSHTMTHRNLSALAPDEVARELGESRATIASQLGSDIALLSYPYGFVTRAVMDASARAGYAGAVTLGFGCARRSHAVHALPRVNVPAGLANAVLECWSSGLRLRPAPIRLSRDRCGTVPSGGPPPT